MSALSLTVDLSLIGADTPVPLVTGGTVRYTNLDYAASAPCLRVVKTAVDALLPWYSSVHRGAGWKSQVTTEAYEGARVSVSRFVNARPDDCVLFVRNTTDAINLLASAVPAGTAVVVFASEHHANLLPWYRGEVVVLPIPRTPGEVLEALEEALRAQQVGLVTVTGASNVTGEIWPYVAMGELAHRYGARLALDAAQLAPHHRIDMVTDYVDYVALSGHKLYAPFGCGALIGPCDWLATGTPYLAGGGAVEFVRVGDVQWAALPDRQEAGSPNVVGAVALGVACDTLRGAGMDRIALAEAEILEKALAGLGDVDGVTLPRMWPAGYPRIAVVPFTSERIGYAKLATVLSAEWGIATRHGCFCAHPLVTELMGVTPDQAAYIAATRRAGIETQIPGMVRMSAGLGTTVDDVLLLVTALDMITTDGPTWTYRTTIDGAHCRPDPDVRSWPVLPFQLGR
jgi:selenocysteine lyase/cysteine desulfurase